MMAQRHRNLRLDEAMELPGCPICRIVLERVAHAVESINYEFVNDPGWRAEVESAWGFCNQHAQQWLEHAHPLGTALIYETVLGRIAEYVARQQASRTGLAARLRSSLALTGQSDQRSLVEPGTCPFCRVREEEAALALDELLDQLGTSAGIERYTASDGLCVTHLAAALHREPNEDVFGTLSAQLAAEYRLMQEQLQEIIRKHDYRFQHELLGDERGAVERAVHQVAGLPGIGDRRYHPPVAG